MSTAEELIAAEDRYHIRQLAEEHGWRDEIEAEARIRFEKRLESIAVQVGVALGLFAIFGGIAFACGAPKWTYLLIAMLSAALSR